MSDMLLGRLETVLPPGWLWKQLGELVALSQNGISKRRSSIGNPTHVLRLADIREGRINESAPRDIKLSDEEVTKFMLRDGDLLCVRVNGSRNLTGRLIYFRTHNVWAYCDHFILFRFKPEITDSKYVAYYFNTQAVRAYLGKHMVSTAGQNTVSQGTMLGITVPVAPLDQQQVIVAEIEKQFSRLDKAVANLKRVKANLKRYKASVLNTAVEGKLTEEWRKQHPDVEPASKLFPRILLERRAHWEKYELAKMKSQGVSPRNETWKTRYKQSEPTKSDETFAIPQGWGWANLGQLSWLVKDGPHYSPKYSERGIPFISGGNIRPEGIDFSTAKFISPELHKELSERCKPEYGDLLYTKGGTTGIARINTERKEFSVWVHVAVLKLVDSINRFYLQLALNSPHCYRQSQKYTHGVGNQDLGLTRMIWITVPLPSIAEQEQIVDEVERRLSVIDELEVAVQSDLTRADRLRQSVLTSAFSGRLVERNKTTPDSDRQIRRTDSAIISPF